MIVGLPKEIKDNEYRVGLTPAGVRALTDANHKVIVEKSAGEGSGFEDSLYQKAGGQIINSSLVDYKVPTFDDVPDEFESILIEDGNGPGPYGAKGLGEGGIIPVAPAVANAVFWSTGARVKSLPLTPEKVWRAIKETQKE